MRYLFLLFFTWSAYSSEVNFLAPSYFLNTKVKQELFPKIKYNCKRHLERSEFTIYQSKLKKKRMGACSIITDLVLKCSDPNNADLGCDKSELFVKTKQATFGTSVEDSAVCEKWMDHHSKMLQEEKKYKCTKTMVKLKR